MVWRPIKDVSRFRRLDRPNKPDRPGIEIVIRIPYSQLTTLTADDLTTKMVMMARSAMRNYRNTALGRMPK